MNHRTLKQEVVCYIVPILTEDCWQEFSVQIPQHICNYGEIVVLVATFN